MVRSHPLFVIRIDRAIRRAAVLVRLARSMRARTVDQRQTMLIAGRPVVAVGGRQVLAGHARRVFTIDLRRTLRLSPHRTLSAVYSDSNAASGAWSVRCTPKPNPAAEQIAVSPSCWRCSRSR